MRKKIIFVKDGECVEPFYSKYKIGKSSWVIAKFETEGGLEFFRVFKQGAMFALTHGNDFETCTEAEINIMLEYKVE